MDKILVLDEILSEIRRRGRKYLVDRIPVETIEGEKRVVAVVGKNQN